MLKYLDKYPIALPIKGGHRPCYWKLIFICSNTTPDEWYTKMNEKTGVRESTIPEDVRQALYRRIGYGPHQNSMGETHIYDPMLWRMEDARQEMSRIVQRLSGRPEVEELPDDSGQEQESQEEEVETLHFIGSPIDSQEERRMIGY